MWTLFTEAQIDAVAQQLFMPLILVVNYTLLQYLLYFYWKRRRELRVQLLFAIGFLGVVCLLPFANPDVDIVQGLNDASESCCVVTFLIQITIIGNDLNARFRLKSVKYLTLVAELLIVADIAMIFVSFAATFSPGLISERLKTDIPNVAENITLFFILFFRFYYIAMARGWRVIVRTRKLELFWYILFTTHELPFELLSSASGVSWEHPQALWNRLTIAACLFVTAHGKIKSASKYNTSVVSVGGDRRSASKGAETFRKRVSLTYRLSQTRQMSTAATTATATVAVAAEPKIVD